MSKSVLAAILIVGDGMGIGSGRIVPTAAAVLGLISVILSVRLLARSSVQVGSGTNRLGVVAAEVAGLISLSVGGVHSANSAGGFGTGNGLAGAIVAIVLGLVGMVLGGVALARIRRSDPELPPEKL